MHPISILPSRFGTTARAQNWRTSARINWLKPTKLSVADDSDSVIPRVCPTPSCNTQAFPFEHLSLYYAKLNSSAMPVLTLSEYFPLAAAQDIVRMEFLAGELLYAMRVVSHGCFNLCPAETCHPAGWSSIPIRMCLPLPWTPAGD